MLQLLQIGLGPLGRRIVDDVHRRGVGRLVAAVDPAAELVGRDVSEIVDGIPEGVVVRASLDEVDDWSAVRCALVTTASDLELCMDTFRGLLARGVPTVSTCEELSWPWLRHPVAAQELHELAVRFGGRLLGTGVNPGFLMDALPVAASTLCESVRRVTIERTQDATPRRIPFQRKIGATLALDEFERRVADGTLRHVGLGESLHFVAHNLGMKLERWTETIEPVVATEAHECGLGTVQPGDARGVRQVATGWVDGVEALELIFHAAIGEPESRDYLRIEGEPPFELVIPGGVHGDVATSAVVVNSIRSLIAAEPGLHTMASIPLRGCSPPDDFSSR
jgi:hypothetical protein